MYIVYITYQYIFCILYFYLWQWGGTPHRLRVIDGVSRPEGLAQFQTEPDIVFLGPRGPLRTPLVPVSVSVVRNKKSRNLLFSFRL